MLHPQPKTAPEAVTNSVCQPFAAMLAMLDGMVRERAGAGGRAVLANAVHIGVGTKPA